MASPMTLRELRKNAPHHDRNCAALSPRGRPGLKPYDDGVPYVGTFDHADPLSIYDNTQDNT
jgi:hypothetical protein